MSETEWLQLGALGGGALVFAAVVYALIRWFRQQGAIFPDAAKHYGLAYSRDKQGSAFTNLRESEQLQGVVDGTPLQAVATYETRGRMRMRSTWIATPALLGWPRGTVNVLRAPPKAKVHLVPSGDAAFDARRWVTSDAPGLARALLTPAVRTALLQCPQAEIRLVVDNANLVLSFGGTPSNKAELHGPIDAVLALARSAAP